MCIRDRRKVTEIGKIYIGLVTTMTKHYTDEGTLLIRNSDIKDGKFEFGDNPIYLEKTFAEKNETRMHQIGDVITVHTGDVGTSAVITENEAKSIGFATIVTRPNPKIIDSNYLCSFLNTDKHKKWAVCEPYFMTMLFVVFMARSRKAEFQIPFERPKMKMLLQSIGISVCF